MPLSTPLRSSLASYAGPMVTKHRPSQPVLKDRLRDGERLYKGRSRTSKFFSTK